VDAVVLTENASNVFAKQAVFELSNIPWECVSGVGVASRRLCKLIKAGNGNSDVSIRRVGLGIGTSPFWEVFSPVIVFPDLPTCFSQLCS
jgi:hypothetical protein